MAWPCCLSCTISTTKETTMATISTPVQVFHNNDPGYLDWIDPPRFKNWTTVGYLKACSDTASDLDAWAHQTTGGRPKACPACWSSGRPYGVGPRPDRATGTPVNGARPAGGAETAASETVV